jgi:hypothetical protein
MSEYLRNFGEDLRDQSIAARDSTAIAVLFGIQHTALILPRVAPDVYRAELWFDPTSGLMEWTGS